MINYKTKSWDMYYAPRILNYSIENAHAVCKVSSAWHPFPMFNLFKVNFGYNGDSKTQRGIHFTVQLYYTKIAVLGAGQWQSNDCRSHLVRHPCKTPFKVPFKNRFFGQESSERGTHNRDCGCPGSIFSFWPFYNNIYKYIY